jgi:hypothetical protein
MPVVFLRFWWTLNFSDKFSRNSQISNFMTIRAVETEFFHANKRTDKQTEGWTDVKRLAIALGNVANALINTSQLLINYKNPVFIIEVLHYRALFFIVSTKTSCLIWNMFKRNLKNTHFLTFMWRQRMLLLGQDIWSDYFLLNILYSLPFGNMSPLSSWARRNWHSWGRLSVRYNGSMSNF